MKIVLMFTLVLNILYGSDMISVASFEQAKIEAKKQNKLILMVYSMDGCPACEYLKDVTFDSDIVKNDLANNFIYLERDVKNPTHKVNGFDPFATPTTYFIDANGNKLGRQIVGATTPQIFKEKIREIKKLASK